MTRDNPGRRGGAAREPTAASAGAGERAPDPAGPWSVYVLRCAGGALYTGITNDMEGRLRAHRAGRGAKYTRGRLPLVLVHEERAASRGAAARREREIKRLGRAGKLALIAAAASRQPGS